MKRWYERVLHSAPVQLKHSDKFNIEVEALWPCRGVLYNIDLDLVRDSFFLNNENVAVTVYLFVYQNRFTGTVRIIWQATPHWTRNNK